MLTLKAKLLEHTVGEVFPVIAGRTTWHSSPIVSYMVLP